MIKQNNVEKLESRHFFLFSAVTFIFTCLVVLVASELIVRLLVPAETFWPISNIYQPSENPNIIYTYKPNFEGVAFGVPIQTNDIGFRGEVWSKEKKTDVFRIALIGDSHAFGYGVAFQETVGETLATVLSKNIGRQTEVLNFGVNGYTSHQQKAVLLDIALNYNPDLVLLLPAGNDHKPSLYADAEGWLHWDGNINNSQSRIIDASIDKENANDSFQLLKKSHLYLYLKLLLKRGELSNLVSSEKSSTINSKTTREWMSSFSPGPVSERLEETVFEPLYEVLETLESNDVPVVIASYIAALDYRQMFQILENKFDVPHIELLALFPEANNYKELVSQFGLGWDNHLNSSAHQRWALAIAEVIDEKKLYQHPSSR